MADLSKLLKELEDKRSEIALYTKTGSSHVGLLSNTTDFRERYMTLQNSGCTMMSKNIKIENRPYLTGYPYKVGVKLVNNEALGYESSVEAGGGNDLYGIAINIHEYGRHSQIVPVTEGMSFACVLIAKDATIKRKDKIKINNDGIAEKLAGAGAYHGLAMEDSVQIVANKLFLVKMIFLGVRPS